MTTKEKGKKANDSKSAKSEGSKTKSPKADKKSGDAEKIKKIADDMFRIFKTGKELSPDEYPPE